ncbi:MAG: nuclear transport factor 2 family protein [Bacteroidota bacterium]
MEAQILELERKYWNGMENHDYEVVKNLTYFPCIVAGKNGVQRVEEPAFKKMFESGADNKMKVKSITGVESLVIGDTATIAYLLEVEMPEQKKEAMKCVCTSTWVKKNGEWTCALHTECDLVAK